MIALALVLAALINIKQSAIGLVAIGVTTFVAAFVHRRVPRLRGAIVVAVTVLPALALYLAWRDFVVTNFVSGELKPLQFSAWNIDLLPQIIGSILGALVRQATFFLCMFAVLLASVLWLRHDRWSRDALLLGTCAGVIVLFNGFLLFTDIVVLSPPDMAARAHSFFRYGSQLSLVVVLGLIVALRPFATRWLLALGGRVRHAAAVPVALILILPPAIAGMLRFDLDAPQPIVWELGHRAARHIKPGAEVRLVVPGDVNDAVGSMLRGVLIFTPPRRQQIEFKMETKADAATLEALPRAGYTLALVSCTPPGLRRAAPRSGNVALYRPRLAAAGGVALSRRYGAAEVSALLARGPLCAAPSVAATGLTTNHAARANPSPLVNTSPPTTWERACPRA